MKSEFHEAFLYDSNNQIVECNLCRQKCKIQNGNLGICKVRKNNDGKLYALSYGRLIAGSVDPIEKKPLFHFLPGSYSYSIATAGCNFKCPWCQNWNISQCETDLDAPCISPSVVVQNAKSENCKSIAYTYTEPTVFFEYAYDCAKLAHNFGIANIFVTNGFMSREAIDMISPYLDSANVDLKSFSEDTYRNIIKADLKGVCDSIKYMYEKGIWVEVTTLIVPGLNDNEEELKSLAEFIASVSVDIPWHISRFYPQYEMKNLEPTPIETLKKAKVFGEQAGLKYIYLGNVQGEDENTYCHNCNHQLIKRTGYLVEQNNINEDGACPKCKVKIPGRFGQVYKS